MKTTPPMLFWRPTRRPQTLSRRAAAVLDDLRREFGKRAIHRRDSEAYRKHGDARDRSAT